MSCHCPGPPNGPPAVCEHATQRYDRSYESNACEMEWAANRRIIDRMNPGYDA